jgi:hypothetical protein
MGKPLLQQPSLLLDSIFIYFKINPSNPIQANEILFQKIREGKD